MIGWDKVVMPLLTYASEACSRCGVKLSCGFTTNGVLLSPSRFDSLIALGLGNTRFQITLDGSKDIHDTSRIGPARVPTYDKIMANVIEGASKGFDISLRFNYTPDTLDSFVDVLDDLESLPKEIKANIKCGFHQVWQTTVHSADIKPKADKIVQLFRSEGFKAESDVTYYRYVCYGDRERHVIVNYNGDIFKCTAREFNPSMREGRLTRSGEMEFNNIYHERMAVKYSNPVCRECDILPICYSGCSQNKLEVARNDCYRDRDRHSKQEYIVRALETQLGF